jgi:peptide-methionine (S)-S-oxide reductase
MPALPDRPSSEYVRKRAKRLARERALRLADAQRIIARDYGFANWTALMRHIASVRDGPQRAPSPLLAAVRAGDLATVRRLLGEGANPRVGDGRDLPLHAAARRGPLELVELLIRGGALEWQPDRRGRTALDVARRNRARDRAAIVALLDRGTIPDPSFRAAVAAIRTGDAAALARLIDAEPRLLHERIEQPAILRSPPHSGYFADPKLLWFIAWNPQPREPMPPTITEIARVMIERGAERSDLDYALELVMSSSAARDAGAQVPLMHVLLAAGANATPRAIAVCAAHRERDALRALLAAGHPRTPPIAAALGDVDALRALLPTADPADVGAAFGFAVINAEIDAARLTLSAGADPNAFLPVHAHSTALHQAANADDVPLIDLLLAHGACLDVRDTLWDGTPHDWALYLDKPAAAAALAAAAQRRSRLPDHAAPGLDPH